jgi:hypothetical protein
MAAQYGKLLKKDVKRYLELYDLGTLDTTFFLPELDGDRYLIHLTKKFLSVRKCNSPDCTCAGKMNILYVICLADNHGQMYEGYASTCKSDKTRFLITAPDDRFESPLSIQVINMIKDMILYDRLFAITMKEHLENICNHGIILQNNINNTSNQDPTPLIGGKRKHLKKTRRRKLSVVKQN